ncbi:MAG: CoA-transferase [Candidatus Kariarchaeaceae archaeon]|jgi:acyl CoA:acetate/3-ketoacid CoA transferase alpha subunit
MSTKITSFEEISKEAIPDGSIIAIGGVHSHNVPMALVRQLIRIGVKDVTIIGSISAGLPIDILVGAGCVRTVLTPYVGFEMWGLAPMFRQAVQAGTIEAPEVCEAFPVYSLRAASNGVPFHPFPLGIHEFSDIHTQSEYYQKVKDPFSGEEVYAIQAITPDIALIHVQQASSDGNCVHLGSVVTDRLMAAAAKKVIVTCDELVDKSVIQEDPSRTTIPGFFVDHLIPQNGAAHPTSSHGKYLYDAMEIKSYLAACKEAGEYRSYLETRVQISEGDYQQRFFKDLPISQAPTPSKEPCSIAELVVTVFARDIKDNELGICGAVSDIPMVAMQLAERMQAPGLRWIAGGSGYVNPRGDLTPSSTDYRRSVGAEARLSMDEVIPLEMQELDFFFAGGIQIDARGNANLAGLPSESGWKLRGPGSVGLPFLPRAKRVYLYTMAHNPRSLVEKVAYISGPGHPEGGNPYGGGPTLLVTNLCVFGWMKSENKWKLSSIHPGVSLDQVKEATGFQFLQDNEMDIPITLVPTDEEIRLIRLIDPFGYLRGYSD